MPVQRAATDSSLVDRINRRAFGRPQARREYGRASGWIDEGERIAFAHGIAAARGGAILDIGIGGGRTVPLLQGAGRSYVGIDFSPAQIAVGRERFPGTDLREMDARALAFGPEQFDLVVFSFNGIDSVGIADRPAALREIHRVLRPGGTFVFSALNLDGPSFNEPFRLPVTRAGKGFWSMLKRALALARWAVMTAVIGTRTYVEIRSAQRSLQNDEMTIKQRAPHYYGVVLTFSSVPAQVRQLAALNFSVDAVYDTDGNARALGQRERHSSWCYYVARKPTAEDQANA
jgi:SAM-dependent methyltransferase